MVYLVPHFHTFVLFVGDLLFIMAPKCSAEVLARVSNQKKAVMCPMEKLHVLGKLRSGMSYSSLGMSSKIYVY